MHAKALLNFENHYRVVNINFQIPERNYSNSEQIFALFALFSHLNMQSPKPEQLALKSNFLVNKSGATKGCKY